MRKIITLVFAIAVCIGAQAQQMVGYEYWLDDDYANRIYTSITANEVLDVGGLNIETNGLSAGSHRIYFRMKDSSGNWSAVVLRNFHHAPFVSTNLMTTIRYWTDQTSGTNAPSDLTEISFITSAQFAEEVIAFDFCHLDAPGEYRVFFQMKDSRGYWSAVAGRDVVIDEIGAPTSATLTLQNDTLFSSSLMGNQWYNQNGLIQDTNASWYVPTSDGDYYAIVSNACGEATSNTITVEVCDENDLPNTPVISVEMDVIEMCSTDAQNYQWFFEGELVDGATEQCYTPLESGNYSVMVSNDCGSATSIEYFAQCGLSDAPTTPIIDANGNTFFVSNGSANDYQWYNQDGPINGENGLSIDLLESGTYFVVVSNECGQETSNSIMWTGIAESFHAFSVSVFPNPTSNVLNIEIAGLISGNDRIQLMNALGKIVLSSSLASAQSKFELTQPSGIYFLNVSCDGITFTQPIVVLK